MASLVEELEAKIRSLNTVEKAELLRSLIAELDGPLQADIEQEWSAAAKRRYLQIAEGSVKAIPADQVFERARAQLKR